MLSHKDLARKIEDLERKFQDHDKKIASIFDAIKQLLYYKEEENKNRGPIGFQPPPKSAVKSLKGK